MHPFATFCILATAFALVLTSFYYSFLFGLYQDFRALEARVETQEERIGEMQELVEFLKTVEKVKQGDMVVFLKKES